MVEGRDTAEGEKPERLDTPTEGVSDRTENRDTSDSATQTPSKLYELASQMMEATGLNNVFRRDRDKAAEGKGFLDFGKGSADGLLTQPAQGSRGDHHHQAGTQPSDKPSGSQPSEKPAGADPLPVRSVKTETIPGSNDSPQAQGFSKDNAAFNFSGFTQPRSDSLPNTKAENTAQPAQPVDRSTKPYDGGSPESTNPFEPKPVKTVTISGPAPGYDGPTTFQPSSSFPGGDKTPHIVELKTKTVDPEVAMGTASNPKNDYSGFMPATFDGHNSQPPTISKHEKDYNMGSPAPAGGSSKWEKDYNMGSPSESHPLKGESGSGWSQQTKDVMFNPTPIANQATPLSGGTFQPNIANRESSGSTKYDPMFSPSSMSNMMANEGKAVDFGGKNGYSEMMKPAGDFGKNMENMAFNSTPIAHQGAEGRTAAISSQGHDNIGGNLSSKDFAVSGKDGGGFDKLQNTNVLSGERGGDLVRSGGGDLSGKGGDMVGGKGEFVKDTSGIRSDLSGNAFKGEATSNTKPLSGSDASAAAASTLGGKAPGDSTTSSASNTRSSSPVTDFSPTTRPTESVLQKSGTETSNIHNSTKVESFEPPKPHAPESGNAHQEKPAEQNKPVPAEQQSQAKPVEVQQSGYKSVAVSGNTADGAIVSGPKFEGSLTLARATTQSGGASSLDNLAAAVGIKAIAGAVEGAAATGDKGIVTGKAISGSTGAEITGPVSLSSLAGAKSGLFIGADTQSGTAALSGKVIANAEAAAGNAALIAAKHAAIESNVPGALANALTSGKGIFDPQAGANRGAQFDVITGKMVQANNLNPNVAAAINSATAQIGNRVIANAVGQQQPGTNAIETFNPNNPGLRPGRLDPVTGRPEALTPGSRIDAVTGRVIAVPGEATKSGEFDLTQLTRVKHSLGGDKRYMTGVEIALAVAIASAAVAKTRPEGNEEDPEASDSDDEKNDPNQPANHFKRPIHLVTASDTLIDIAERLFHNSDVAWLIADINVGRISEHMEDGKRIVELRSRQEIELPLPSEVNDFLLHKKADIKGENMVTIVGVSEIDRELLNSFLSTVVGGEKIDDSVPAPSTVLVPAGASPQPQPLMALVNFGVAMGKTLMPSMNSLVLQGLNLRTYISKIDFIHSRTGLKPEPQR